jgi:20S proteasome alpha/beta subunit
MAAQQYATLPPTVFAPGGRLFSVERACQGVQDDTPSHNLVVAIHCAEGIVVVTSSLASSYLAGDMPTHHTNSSNRTSWLEEEPLVLPDTGIPRPPFCRLSSHLWGVTAGHATDAQLLRLQLQAVTEDLRGREDSEQESLAQPSVVARSLADLRHRATQAPASGQDVLLNATAVVFGDTPGQGQNGDLWRVDPTGQFWQCTAVVVGRRADVAEADLLDRLAQRVGVAALPTHDADDTETTTTTLRRPSPATLRRCLAELTQEEALALAAACIREALAVKTTTSTATMNSASPVSLKGLCFKDGQPHWLTDQEL